MVFAAVILLGGCANLPKPLKESPKQGSAVGVMLLVDEKPKHVHAATLIFGNFTRKDVSDWKLKELLYQNIRNAIEQDFKLKAKRIAPTGGFEPAGVFGSDETPVKALAAIRERDAVAFLVVLKPVAFPVWLNSTLHPKGYGMFTRCQLGFCHADVFDHVEVSVYDLNTNQLIGAVGPQKNIDGAQGVAAIFSLNNHDGSPKCPSGDFMSRMNRLSGAPS